MKTLVIISCVKEKVWKKCPSMGAVKASDAYISNYFRAQKRFALATQCDWMILSAKYGFLFPDELIENYDITFKRKPYISNDILSQQVKVKQLQKYSRIIVIGGESYRDRVQKAFNDVNCQLIFPVTGQRGNQAPIKKINELTTRLDSGENIDDIIRTSSQTGMESSPILL